MNTFFLEEIDFLDSFSIIIDNILRDPGIIYY